MLSVIVLGGGEHARVVLDSLHAQGQKVCGLFDPKYTGELFGVRQLGRYDPNYDPEAKAIVAIGDNRTRKLVVQNTRHAFITSLDPTCIISRHAVIGMGCMILQGTVIQAQTRIGDHVILNTGATVDHDCFIGDYVHVAPGVTICGRVHIEEGALVGAGAVILPGIKIGKWAVVGAGAVVVNDVSDSMCVVGNPAKELKRRPIQ